MCTCWHGVQNQFFTNILFCLHSDKLNDGAQVTFSFNFFVHGDSNVCGNVDVRQHEAVYPISKEDLQAAQSLPGGLRGEHLATDALN